jgi:predicted TIM-barrel fold metal-dependent hydrolase
MIDTHVHIGQFKEIYYTPLETLNVILETGIEHVVFSSTTSCIDNIKYTNIECEIEEVLMQMGTESARITPLFWSAPYYIDQGITVKNSFNNLPYGGFKIHPRAHNWDLTDSKTVSMIHEIFDYADLKELPVLIHTGRYDKLDEANKFSQFFSGYKKAKLILAHGVPTEQVINLMLTYSNVYCDTAFAYEDEVQAIVHAKLGDRILLGSDFPVTHYFTVLRNRKTFTFSHQSLQDQYLQDLAQMNKYYHMIKQSKKETNNVERIYPVKIPGSNLTFGGKINEI